MKKIQNFIIILLTLFLITLTFTFVDSGTLWDDLSIANYKLVIHLSLILYRFTIYTIPALIIFIYWRLKPLQSISITNAFSIQFISYSIIVVIWHLFALDELLSTPILGSMNSFVIVIGLMITMITGDSEEINTKIRLSK